MTIPGHKYKILYTMRKTSKKYFPEKFSQEIWKPFQKEIKSSQSYKDIVKALNMILTEEEKTICEKRLAIKFLLSHGAPSWKIQEIVDANKATVRFVKYGFKRKGSVGKKKESEKEESDALEDLLENLFGGERIFRKYRYLR